MQVTAPPIDYPLPDERRSSFGRRESDRVLAEIAENHEVRIVAMERSVSRLVADIELRANRFEDTFGPILSQAESFFAWCESVRRVFRPIGAALKWIGKYAFRIAIIAAAIGAALHNQIDDAIAQLRKLF